MAPFLPGVRTQGDQWIAAAIFTAVPWLINQRLESQARTLAAGDRNEIFNRAILDFLDHYLRDDAGGLARLQARAAVPGVATREQAR